MRAHILGAGIIGLSVADELLRRGHQVTVVDPAPGSGASFVAAGMLSPSAEVWHGESAILTLGLRSQELWPEYAARLGVPLPATGTLLVGLDHGDRQQVDRQLALLAEHGRDVAPLSPRELLAREPTLTPRVAGGAHLVEDHSVDPRAVVAALLRRVPVVADRPAETPDVTVIATGARLPAPYAHLVRSVRGETVRVRTDDPPARVVRGWVHGDPTYVVPRLDGEVVIGATSEEHDGPPVPSVEGVARLLEGARALLPGLDRAEFVTALAGDRPGSPDNLPLVGPAHEPGVLLAAGHFRHGVLLAPLTARLVADHVDSGHVEPTLDPRRFPSADRRTA